ncbi:hypothetical protein PoB_003678900 [Plakobranchus ocellatus]|uniref:DDE-1 domain-containing protein n=1 Tax=Plakobranchus ocellatus TaxID=259542 RepID=A0AAV4AVA6_9GAST|nr:hypothetical protein PoB_003678900 [Plakobranchus ocellatus]
MTDKYPQDLEGLITSLGIKEKLDNVWNYNEKIFSSHINKKKCWKKRDTKMSANREDITVLTCISAGGKAMPSMMIIKGKTPRSVYNHNTSDTLPGTSWGFQDSGLKMYSWQTVG